MIDPDRILIERELLKWVKDFVRQDIIKGITHIHELTQECRCNRDKDTIHRQVQHKFVSNAEDKHTRILIIVQRQMHSVGRAARGVILLECVGGDRVQILNSLNIDGVAHAQPAGVGRNGLCTKALSSNNVSVVITF